MRIWQLPVLSFFRNNTSSRILAVAKQFPSIFQSITKSLQKGKRDRRIEEDILASTGKGKEKFMAFTEAISASSPERKKPVHFLIPDKSRMDKVRSFQNEREQSEQLMERKRLAELEKKTRSRGIIPFILNNSIYNWVRPLMGRFRRKGHELIPADRLERSFGRRICIVGVHGWFPTKVLQTLVGVPRGTSARLCSMMAEITREFLDTRPLAYFEPPPRIDTIPLEGEGCIRERVDRHYAHLEETVTGTGMSPRQMLIEADCVIFVAHSQGAPVAALLMERLLREGILSPRKRQNVGILTLAGVFHGPFPGLRENLVVRYVEADAARELFDLNDPQHDLSRQLHSALKTLLEEDVLMAGVASWMDQVVPLHSSTLLGVDHPNLWRSVYIDSHNYRPDFLSALVETALTMVNGRVKGSRQLLTQLGEALAGSLYQSNAHSTLYSDHGVYASILHWMMSSPKRPESVPVSFFPDEMLPRHNPNPYLLPWIMRGIVSDEKLCSHPLMVEDLRRLATLHQQWTPDRKILKDLKLQLAPLSKL